MPYRHVPPPYNAGSDVDAIRFTHGLDQDVPDLAAALTPAQRPPPAGESSPEPEAQADSNRSKEPVAWKDLPRKDQLIIITLARMSEPLVQTSLQVRTCGPQHSLTHGLTKGERDTKLTSQCGIDTVIHVLPAQMV
jgi:hypothetical protein